MRVIYAAIKELSAWIPAIKAILDSFEGLGKLCEELRYWFKCNGGKQIVDMVLTGTMALLAIVALAVSVSAMLLAGSLLATLAAATSALAYDAAADGKYGLSENYSKQDKLSDVLRDKNFHDKRLNNLSNLAADGFRHGRAYNYTC